MSAVKEILLRLHPDIDVDNCTTLIDDSILDSFDIITLVSELANDHDVRIPAEEIVPENFNSAAALEQLCARLMED